MATGWTARTQIIREDERQRIIGLLHDAMSTLPHPHAERAGLIRAVELIRHYWEGE